MHLKMRPLLSLPVGKYSRIPQTVPKQRGFQTPLPLFGAERIQGYLPILILTFQPLRIIPPFCLGDNLAPEMSWVETKTRLITNPEYGLGEGKDTHLSWLTGELTNARPVRRA